MHSTLTSRGQTTIPKEVRRALKLKPGDMISYEISGDSVILKTLPSISSLLGSMRYENMPLDDLKRIREQSVSQWAAHAAKEGQE